jgi:cold shock CspA family protein
MSNGRGFNARKGFGFIQPDCGEGRIRPFSAVERAGTGMLSEGQPVSLDIVQDRSQESAGNLKLI